MTKLLSRHRSFGTVNGFSKKGQAISTRTDIKSEFLDETFSNEATASNSGDDVDVDRLALFRRTVGQLQWQVLVRPDIACGVKELARKLTITHGAGRQASQTSYSIPQEDIAPLVLLQPKLVLDPSTRHDFLLTQKRAGPAALTQGKTLQTRYLASQGRRFTPCRRRNQLEHDL